MATKQPLVLLVDDEEDLCLLMQMTLARMGIKTHLAYRVEQAKKFFTEFQYDACLTDLNLPDGNGLDLVKHVTQNYPNTPIAVLTAYGNMDIAIAALKAGAFDFVSKPVNQTHLDQLIQKALNRPQPEQEAAETALENKLLIGRSAPIQQLRIALKKIARSQAPVFITGESGTGKEVVANLVHRLSNRSEGPFIAINCGAIPTELMESELFGHKKGSFTGAAQDKQGLILSAHGGSLFLDEIAELPLNMQVKLLRAVQEKKIRPVGSDQEIDVDFRVISASHQDLELLVQQGRFRQKQAQHLRGRRTQGFQQTDFSLALANRHQHHIHDQNARHDQADRCNAPQCPRQCAQNIVERANQRILRNDGNVIFTVMALTNNLFNILFGLRQLPLAGCGNNDAKQRRRIKQIPRTRHRNHHHIAHVRPQRLPLTG